MINFALVTGSALIEKMMRAIKIHVFEEIFDNYITLKCLKSRLVLISNFLNQNSNHILRCALI